MPDIPAFEQSRPIEPPKVHYNADFNPFKTSSASSYSSGGSYPRQSVEWEGLYSGLEKASRMNEPVEEEPLAFEEAVSAVTEAVEPASQSSSLYSGDSSSMEKGAQHLQFKGRFILTSVKSGLMLIDQHRAHVRVLFDRYMSSNSPKAGSISGGVISGIDSIASFRSCGVGKSVGRFGGSRFRLQSFRWRQLRYQWYSFRHRGVESGRTGAQYGTYRHGERQ